MAQEPSVLKPLHPLLQLEVDARRRRPALGSEGLESTRLGFATAQMQGNPGPEMAAVESFDIPGPAGRLKARLYQPALSERLPLLVYFHGGGFVLGSLDSHDRNARRLASAASTLVLSIEYRLAPENPFPAAFEDAQRAIEFAHREASALGADSRRIFAGGDSAGGALALSAAVETSRRDPDKLAGVAAFYPITDLSNVGGTRSYTEFGDGRAGLSTGDVLWFREHYAPRVSDQLDPRCSPLLDRRPHRPAESLADQRSLRRALR